MNMITPIHSILNETRERSQKTSWHRVLGPALTLFALAVLTSGLFSQTASAQFSGMIYYTFNHSDNVDLQVDDLVIITDKDRMLIQSSDAFSLMNGTESSSILIRNDKEDFVIGMDAERSLVLAKTDLDMFMKLTQQLRNVRDSANASGSGGNAGAAGSGTGSGSTSMAGLTMEETGNTQKFHGYKAKEMKVQFEKEGDYMLFWYSEDFSGNWSMLSHLWATFGREIFEDATPVEWVMQREIFPLKVDLFRGGNLLYSAEATEISRSKKHLDKLTPNPSVRMLNFQQFVMDLMMQQ